MSFNWPADDLTVKEKIGVGTDTPAEKLEVKGNIKLNSGVAVGEFSSDGTLATASNLSVPTTQVVKTYVDAQVATVNTALTTKADKGGSLTQNFQANNLTVQGNLEVTGTTTFRNIEQHQGDLELGNEDTDQVRIHGTVRSTHSSGTLQIASPLNVTGNVGIGTATPQGKLEVKGDIRAGNSDIYFTKIDHNYSGIGNTTGFAAIENAADYGALMILGRAGTPKGRYVRLWDYLQVNGGMDVTGNIGIGVPTPAYRLDVGGRMRIRQLADGNATAGIWFSGYYRQEYDAAFVGMKSTNEVGFWGNTGSAGWRLFVNTDNGTLSVTGGAFKPGGGAWGSPSDERLKDNIRPLPNALDRLLKLRGVLYEWKQPETQGNLTGPQIGLIAQEVEEVFPDWVGVDAAGYKNITIRGFEALTVEAFKQLNAENEQLKIRCETLEARLKKLEEQLQTIMSRT